MSEPAFPAGNLPDTWGEGAVFAYSGLDGPTDTSSGFAATLAAERYSFLWHTPARRRLQIRTPGIDSPLLVTGDTVVAETQAGELFISFAAWHTLVGLAPAQTAIRLLMEDGTLAEVRGEAMVSVDPQGRDALALCVKGPIFTLAYGRSADEAIARAEAGLSADLNEIAPERLRIYGAIPPRPNDALDRLLRRCASVMKAHTLSAEGAIRQAWSTPARVSGGDLRPADSVFHALAMNRIYPGIAWQVLKSALDTQNTDGMIPGRRSVDGRKSDITCPPLLAWGVWENYLRLRDTALLEYAFPRLEDCIDWDTNHRDRNRNGLLEWAMGDDASRRCPESGMDDSPRFDEGVLLDAVDFSVLAAREMLCLARIAGELGHADDAKYWHEKSAYTSLKVHELLWDEEAGFYCDCHMDGSPSRVLSVAGFLPLLLDDIPTERVGRLVEKLEDPRHFNTAFPIPSVAACTPGWSAEGWRGAAWATVNFLVILGLRKHGRDAEAARLRADTIEQVLRHYERRGVLFEFCDAADSAPPARIRDAHGTAAAVACLLMEDIR